MALSVKAGQFTGQGSTGNQAVTGVGFQPKAIVFYTTDRTVIGTGGNVMNCIGFATSSTARGTMSRSSAGGEPTSDVDNDNWSTRCIFIRDDGSGTPRFEADFVSFDTDGFTVNWIDAGDSIIFYLAIGGTDLTDAQVGHFPKKTSTGLDAITGVGFQPDIVFIMGELNQVQDSTAIDSSLFLGSAVSPTSRWCTHGSSEDGRPSSDTGRNQRTNQVIYQTNENGAAAAVADLDSMDSDGFTLNYSTANASTLRYTYLALKGGTYKLGSFNGATSTGNQAVSAVGVGPKAEMFSSFGAATSGSEVAHNRINLGLAVSSTERFSVWTGDEDAQTVTDCAEEIENTKCLRFSDEGPTLLASADFVSQDSDGFTVNWDTVDAISREILYCAFGDTPAAPGDDFALFTMAGGL